ncbi:MAG TPA: CoA ester lyase [Candidatus Acidoferrum sp.]|nr:CoA ester lyase [Candidatus Acidoferrum sp.]
MNDPLLRVRSALFTPGTEAVRLRKAITAGADVCIFDLEDSVPSRRTGEARAIVREALEELAGRARIWLRVHPASSQEMAEDLRAMPLSRLEAVMLPKASHRDDVEACRRAMKQARVPAELPVVPIIESAAGVLACAGIAEVTGVRCLAFGRFDLAADLGIDPDGSSAALDMSRASVILASTAERLELPLDSPWLKITDLDGLRAAAERARADGFGGMLVIHPSHVTTVNEVFSPTADEIAWAQGIVASSAEAESGGRSAYTRDGEMVDEAIVRRARAILRDTEP